LILAPSPSDRPTRLLTILVPLFRPVQTPRWSFFSDFFFPWPAIFSILSPYFLYLFLFPPFLLLLFAFLLLHGLFLLSVFCCMLCVYVSVFPPGSPRRHAPDLADFFLLAVSSTLFFFGFFITRYLRGRFFSVPPLSFSPLIFCVTRTILPPLEFAPVFFRSQVFRHIDRGSGLPRSTLGPPLSGPLTPKIVPCVNYF